MSAPEKKARYTVARAYKTDWAIYDDDPMASAQGHNPRVIWFNGELTNAESEARALCQRLNEQDGRESMKREPGFWLATVGVSLFGIVSLVAIIVMVICLIGVSR